MGEGLSNTITNCFGKAEFEADSREENYKFDPENDLPRPVKAKMNTVMNQIKFENATFNDFDENLVLKDVKLLFFRLLMRKNIIDMKETDTAKVIYITTFNNAVSAVRGLKQFSINNNHLQVHKILSSIETHSIHLFTYIFVLNC